MPQTHLAGLLDYATPQRDTALRDGDSGQGSTCLVPAAPPFNTHPIPATPSAGCAWGTCPGVSPQGHYVGLPHWRRCPISLEGRPMAPGLPAPAPSITPGSGLTDSDLPLTLGTLTSCLSIPILAASRAPTSGTSASSCPTLPCGSQGSSWQGQLQPQQLGPGQEGGAVGTIDAGAPCTRRDTPSSVQLLPGGGKKDVCHSKLGFLGA